MTITKIHRILKFNQKPWLKKYVLKNIKARKKTKSFFKKQYFKIAINALFGKMLQKQENLTNSFLIYNEDFFFK